MKNDTLPGQKISINIFWKGFRVYPDSYSQRVTNSLFQQKPLCRCVFYLGLLNIFLAESKCSLVRICCIKWSLTIMIDDEEGIFSFGGILIYTKIDMAPR